MIPKKPTNLKKQTFFPPTPRVFSRSQVPTTVGIEDWMNISTVLYPLIN